jgi:hypothetical protein
MGLFSRKQSTPREARSPSLSAAVATALSNPSPPTDADWYASLQNTASRSAAKHAKATSAAYIARRDAYTQLTRAGTDAGAPPSDAVRVVVADALALERAAAGLDALGAAALLLLDTLPRLSAATAAGGIPRAALPHAATVISAAAYPPLVAEAAHVADMLSLSFGHDVTADVRPARAVIEARSSALPHERATPSRALHTQRLIETILAEFGSGAPPVSAETTWSPQPLLATEQHQLNNSHKSTNMIQANEAVQAAARPDPLERRGSGQLQYRHTESPYSQRQPNLSQSISKVSNPQAQYPPYINSSISL